MKIEEGKFYRTRDGRKAGPIEERPQPHDGFPFGGRNESGLYELYTRDGFVVHGGTTAADLVAEWEDPDPIPLIRQMREALELLHDHAEWSRGDTYRDSALGISAREAMAAADEFLKA